MNKNILKALLLAAVFLAGLYMVKKERDTKPAPEVSTLGTTEATPTLAEPTFTQRTTIPPNPYSLPECIALKTPCRRDRCHFGNALNRNSTILCEQIVDPVLGNKCLEKLKDAQTQELASIEGQVFNPVDCGVYPDLPVEIRDETNNVTLTTTKTNRTGEYGITTPPGRLYGIYVSVDGKLLNQNITAGAAGRYIADFALS